MKIIDNKDLHIMKEGGKKLAEVREALKKKVTEGVSAFSINEYADRLIEQSGGKPSFKMVKNYSWATCINVNEGVVHGIPHKGLIFQLGDLVSVDVGLFYKGFHTDTSFSVQIGNDKKLASFLEVGRLALDRAIDQARVGNRIYDVSQAMELTLEKSGLNPIRSLTGHGIGRVLHEEPYIPCFVQGNYENTPAISLGDTLALEVMYTKGSGELVKEADGWTISTSDGKIAGLFEDTVCVTSDGPLILTRV